MGDDDQSQGETNEASEDEKKSEESPLKDELAGLQSKIESGKQREQLKDELDVNKDAESFFGKLFGVGTKVTLFLAGISTWMFSKIGLEKKALDWEDFEEQIAKEEVKAAGGLDFEEHIVSHRGLGYGDHNDNTKEGIEAALDADEDQIEFDIRVHDGVAYVYHDKIDPDNMEIDELPKLKDILTLFAEHKNQNAVLFLDVKEKDAVALLVKEMEEIDQKHLNEQGYIPLKKRNMVTSFNPEVLAEAQKSLNNPPLIFHYFPTDRLTSIDISDYIGDDHAKKIFQSIDKLSGGQTSTEEDSKNISIHIEDGFPSEKNPDAQERVYIYSLLPDQTIIDMIKKSEGFISIHLELVTEALMSEAKAQGLKVAIWGVDSDTETQRAILLGANLVFSNKPNVIN